jgi:hypothetical protein
VTRAKTPGSTAFHMSAPVLFWLNPHSERGDRLSNTLVPTLHPTPRSCPLAPICCWHPPRGSARPAGEPEGLAAVRGAAGQPGKKLARPDFGIQPALKALHAFLAAELVGAPAMVDEVKQPRAGSRGFLGALVRECPAQRCSAILADWGHPSATKGCP